jgi:hypothetical protein
VIKAEMIKAEVIKAKAAQALSYSAEESEVKRRIAIQQVSSSREETDRLINGDKRR